MNVFFAKKQMREIFRKIVPAVAVVILTICFVAGAMATRASARSDDGIKVLLSNPEKDEIANESGWKIAQYEYRTFMNDLSAFPVSFVYDGVKYNGFGNGFECVSSETVTENSKESTVTVLKHTSGFTVRLETALYLVYGAYEWTIRIENDTEEDTAVFTDFNSCDVSFAGTNPHLKGLLGDQYCQYYPYDYNLLLSNIYFSTNTGRSSEEYFPYFNLETDSGGALVALGWPGNWEADFCYGQKQTNIKMRQKNLRTYLKPGESLRSPLNVVVRYGVRDEDEAMNVWRRWYINCNMPRVNGELIEPQIVAGSSAYTDETVNATETILLNAIKTFARNGIRFDYWWMDAGWYVKPDNSKIGSWMEVGTWEIDQTRFPTKFKEISDYAASLGTKTILWFEPETIRVDLDTLVANCGFNAEWAIPDTSWGNAYLVDMANPEFREWLLNRVNTILREGNLSVYREDFNVRPADAWRRKDENNRVGIYENEYISGHFAYWDAILAANPGIYIDSCASGGNRNDVETMRRAVPLHVSDSAYGEYGAKQSMCYQLYKWLPYFGSPVNFAKFREPDVYDMRNCYYASMNMPYYFDLTDEGYQKIFDCMQEFRQVSKYLYSDYYPLTEYSRDETSYMGWEFFDKDLQEGYVQLFRREECEQDSYLLKFKGLSDDAIYLITDLTE